jgi:hypothetical protein
MISSIGSVIEYLSNVVSSRSRSRVRDQFRRAFVLQLLRGRRDSSDRGVVVVVLVITHC